MESTFRPADDGNIEVVIDLMRQSYESERRPFDEGFARVALERLVADEALGGVWIIQRDDESIGFVAVTLGYSLELPGQIACVDELFVMPGQRNQGMRTAALRFLAGICRERGAVALRMGGWAERQLGA